MNAAGTQARLVGPGVHASLTDLDGLAGSFHDLSGLADTISATVRSVLADPHFVASLRYSPATAAGVEAHLDAALRGGRGIGSLSAEFAGDAAKLRWSSQAYRDADSAACAQLDGMLAEVERRRLGPGQRPHGQAGPQHSRPPASHQPSHQPSAQHAPAHQPGSRPSSNHHGASAHAPTSNVAAHAQPGTGHVSSARQSILARAKNWSDRGVAYSSGVHLSGYRTDCSGFVSMCWDLPRSLTTASLPSVAHRISAADLQPGDILLNTSPGRGGHAVMFDHWANARHTAYMAYEETPSGCHHHVIPYPYYAGHGHFAPYRLNSLH